jgi:transposase
MQVQTASLPKVYIGKDIHKKSFHVTIRTDIAEHKSISFAPDAEALFQYVDTHFPDSEVQLCYEAGCCGFSTARHYAHLGWNVVVVNPADVPTMHKQNFQKTDKIDSRNLCKQLQMGNLKPIYIPTEDQEQFRALLRHRMQLAKDLRRIKSQLKGTLLFHGIKVPEQYDNANWTHAFIDWMNNIPWSNACGASNLKYKLQSLAHIKKQYLDVGTELRAYAKKTYPREYQLLKSIPGIGGFIAAALLAEVGDFNRFSNEAEFSSFIGVVPGIYNSGGSEKNLGVTPRANHVLRPLLVEAVWVAISKDPEMQAYYKSHVGKNPKSIVVKCAHKLVRRILAIIKTGIPYQININLCLDKKVKLSAEAQAIIQEHEAD